MSSDTTDTGAPEYPRQDEAVRDGIGEEDAPIPMWFNVGFYGLMVVGLVYIAYYLLSGWSAAGQYAAEVEAAEQRIAATRASLPSANPYHGDQAAIAQGGEIFAQNCAVCHKPDGSGLVGPSLVDPYWKYGHADADLLQTVSEGRPLGMPPWGAILGTDKIWKVLAFVEQLPKSDEPGVGSPEYDAAAAARAQAGG